MLTSTITSCITSINVLHHIFQIQRGPCVDAVVKSIRKSATEWHRVDIGAYVDSRVCAHTRLLDTSHFVLVANTKGIRAESWFFPSRSWSFPFVTPFRKTMLQVGDVVRVSFGRGMQTFKVNVVVYATRSYATRPPFSPETARSSGRLVLIRSRWFMV